MAQGKHVFISYAQKDAAFVSLVKAHLEQANIPVWLDDEISVGQAWRFAIDKALRNSFAVIVILTATSVESQFVNYESAFALGVGIPVIPIIPTILGEVALSQIPPRLSNIQCLVIRDDDPKPWALLLESLLAIQSANPLPRSNRSIIDALRDQSYEVRVKAALTLANTGDERSVPVLIDILQGNDNDLKISAVKALVQADPTGVLELISDAISDQNRKLKWVTKSVDKGLPKHIFISYSREDTNIMKQVKERFQNNQFTVWTDENLEKGTPSWKIAIELAIETSGCLVAIFSPNAKRSRWVREEIDYAASQKKQIFPVLAHGDEQSAIPLGFTSVQLTDIRDRGYFELEMEKLLDAIRKCIYP